MRMKRVMRMINRMKRTMMRASGHAYVDPPHWRARRRQTVPGRKHSVPSGSSWEICSLKVVPALEGALAFRK